MRVDIAWWDLDGSTATVDSLRDHLRDGTAEQWGAVEGLRLKFWMADREHNRWGAVMLWEAGRPADMPPNRAAEIIGYPPTHRYGFDVEAVVEGACESEALHGLGPVFAA
jgi:trans-2,3-dihydro-3-hydroxyanthranilate isomerase